MENNKGLWHYEPAYTAGTYTIYDERDNTIANNVGLDDAILIHAAPDLLEACQTALAALTYGMERGMNADAEVVLRAAIAKAKSEK